MDQDDPWIARWLDAVQAGTATMSQRNQRSIAAHGGIDRAIAAAEARGVHLVALTDDTGEQLVAASLHPFRALC